VFADAEVVLCRACRFIVKKPVILAHAAQLQSVCPPAECSVKDQ
jgi:hypothetical protein